MKNGVTKGPAATGLTGGGLAKSFAGMHTVRGALGGLLVIFVKISVKVLFVRLLHRLEEEKLSCAIESLEILFRLHRKGQETRGTA